MPPNLSRQTVYTYRRWTPAEFSVALTDLGVTPNEFAVIYGVPPGRVHGWLNGEQDIPAGIPMFCGLLSLPGAVQFAHAVATQFITGRRDAGR